MKDIAYCNYEICLHRYGCKRFTGNYKKELNPEQWLDGAMCVDSGYTALVRFRHTVGGK